jgi:hypothetical protein
LAGNRAGRRGQRKGHGKSLSCAVVSARDYETLSARISRAPRRWLHGLGIVNSADQVTGARASRDVALVMDADPESEALRARRGDGGAYTRVGARGAPHCAVDRPGRRCRCLWWEHWGGGHGNIVKRRSGPGGSPCCGFWFSGLRVPAGREQDPESWQRNSHPWTHAPSSAATSAASCSSSPHRDSLRRAVAAIGRWSQSRCPCRRPRLLHP